MKKTYLLIALFLAAFIAYWISTAKDLDYYEPPALATHFNGEQFVGSETCRECHRDIYEDHIRTAHYHTSAIADADNIKGSFEDGANTLDIGEAVFTMVKEGRDFYQTGRLKSTDDVLPPQKIDIVIGSGVKGQSYLSWEADKLFQLQTSYYPPADRWVNSPGYPQQLLRRPIRDGCLKCHVTFATNLDFSGQGNQYDKARMVYGVDCERCHRPAGKHVIYHRKNPDVQTAKYILKLDTLSRQLRLDACAQCHSGPRAGIIKGNAFSYLSGEPLKEYSRNFYTGLEKHELDVHGNQYGLLTSSACFINSPRMDCSTCHSPHQNQRGKTTFFNQQCRSCHQQDSQTCTEDPAKLQDTDHNCISCHMPEQPSRIMSVQFQDNDLQTSVYVRTHLIGIYPEEARKRGEE